MLLANKLMMIMMFHGSLLLQQSYFIRQHSTK